MSNVIRKTIVFLLKIFTALAAGYYIVLFLYIAISRISFPCPFDWVEGAVLVQANRALLGQGLYLAPSAAYIPLVYQPLYFYIAAAFIKWFGLSLMSARLLSMLASCGCIWMVFLLTKKASGACFSGFVSAGLFAATNGIVWTWFDFAKVDMLCVFLFLVGLYFLRQDNHRGAILAGIAFALSLFTKQTAGFMLIPVFIYYFFTKRKQALLFMLVFAFLTGAGILLLNYESNNWYLYYVAILPSYHRLDTSAKNVTYIVVSLFRPILPVLAVALVSILANLRKFARDDAYRFFVSVAGGALAISIWGALITGSTRNAFIPAYALTAVACGLGLQYLQENVVMFSSGNVKLIGFILLLGVCLLQFSFLQYKTRDYIPTAQDFKRANALIKYLQNTDGEFLIPTQNYLALYVNKPVYYHDAPLGEFNGWYGKTMPEWKKIKGEIVDIVRSKKVSVVYMEKPVQSWLGLTCQQEDTFQSNSKFVPTLYKMTCH